MALEALSSNDLSNFITYDALCSAQHYSHAPPLDTSSVDDKIISDGVNKSLHFGRFRPPELHPTSEESSPMIRRNLLALETADGRPNSATTTQGRKKRRRRPKVCKNKEEAETQRMTHIAVERNRRKQMNEHLAVLRSLMPESYIQRVEEGCHLTSVDDIASAVHHMLRMINDEAALAC
uniref:BHLH domain-containing protein n=1 Tax=Nelumbo nucifera TaxID=4432 RepID=A0A822ZW34_NELNU|nr:TPA_asm: hypothetical protein HUJ06_017416 [Nelumbo nucifera]